MTDVSVFGDDMFSPSSSKPQAASAPQGPRPDVPDGTYVLRGKSLQKGTFKRGKHEGRPYVRFLHEIAGGDHDGRLVGQMLPWFPGWNVFEDNFEILAGMTVAEFGGLVRAKGAATESARMALFLEVFRGAQFTAEVRGRQYEGRQYLDVVNLTGRASGPDAAPAAGAQQPASPPPAPDTAPEPSASAPAAEEGRPAGAGAVKEEIQELGARMSLDADALSAVAEEEFGKPLDRLDGEELVTLRDVLAERRALDRP